LLGSKYFTAHPTVNAKSLVANLNVDSIHAILPMKEVAVYGIDESDLGDAARRAAASQNMTADAELELHGPAPLLTGSDHTSFVLHGIPAIRLMVGFPGESGALLRKFRRERYHTPLDNPQQPVNLETGAKFEETLMQLLLDVANDPHRPQWKTNSFYKRYAAK
jgi:Zn-dependent M28 family amino/carboxypeptidase